MNRRIGNKRSTRGSHGPFDRRRHYRGTLHGGYSFISSVGLVGVGRALSFNAGYSGCERHRCACYALSAVFVQLFALKKSTGEPKISQIRKAKVTSREWCKTWLAFLADDDLRCNCHCPRRARFGWSKDYKSRTRSEWNSCMITCFRLWISILSANWNRTVTAYWKEAAQL